MIQYKSTDLSGIWSFCFSEGKSPEKVNHKTAKCTDYMTVPGTFDTVPGYEGKRGTAVYKKEIFVPAETNARLKFGAVSMCAQIYIDNVLVKEHCGGYHEFWADIPRSKKERRALTVVCDNLFDFSRNKMHEEYFDFYQYGGIIRPVSLYILPEVYCSYTEIKIQDYKKGLIQVVMEFNKKNIDEEICISIDEKKIHSAPVKTKTGILSLKLAVPKPRPWSPDNPALHTMSIRLCGFTENIRIGLREIKVMGSKLFLNGKEIKLLGFNRHEAHPQFGSAVPVHQMLADLGHLREMGCNFIRGSHYPQDQRFLDLCDEMGFLVWEENLGWGQQEYHYKDKLFLKQELETIEEMVRASINHPCVIMWGFSNETDTTIKPARKYCQTVIRKLKECDPDRPVTFADCRCSKSVCLDLADILSLNLYPGWYSGDLDNVVPAIRDIIKLARKKGGDKPLIISEIGAGAIYGWRDEQEARWTEQFQSKLIRLVCEETIQNKGINGLAIWQYCDCRTHQNVKALFRPRAFNNKGLLDEYRRKKSAYDVVRTIFTGSHSQ